MNSWVDINDYDPNEICPICTENFGRVKAIYKTPCNHMFHNNCLLNYCESKKGIITCPICRKNLDDSCLDVWNFKEHNLGSIDGRPLFNSEHVSKLYERKQRTPSRQGGKKQKTQKNKRNKRNKRNKKKYTNKKRNQ